LCRAGSRHRDAGQPDDRLQSIFCQSLITKPGYLRTTDVITTLSREKLAEFGIRYRADYLVEQAGYTLGIAAQDGPKLAELLPERYLDGVKAALDRVNASMGDKALIRSEAKQATVEQNKAVAEAKVWRRKVMNRCRMAGRMGRDMPVELVLISEARTIPAIAGQLDNMVKLLEASQGSLPGSAAVLIQQGQGISKALREADARQEVKRLKELPDTVQAFYINKGMLYIGLKVLNDAGRELHADAPVAAAKYNLSILHRHVGNAKPGQPVPQGQGSK